MSNSIPVNPLLDQDDRFISLLNYSKEPIKPNPFNGADPGRSVFGQEYLVSRSGSSKLELAAIGGIETKMGTTMFVHDSIIYRLSRATPKNASSLIKATWWGYGIRVRVMIKNMQLGVKAGWGAVAAAVQLGYAEAEFEVESIGIPEALLFDLLPEPMDLTMSTFNEILKIGDEFRKIAHSADPSGIIYRPLRIVADPGELNTIDPIDDDRHFIFTYTMVSERTRLKNARAIALEKDLNPSLIEKYYNEVFGITSDSDKPSGEARDKARDWLNV